MSIPSWCVWYARGKIEPARAHRKRQFPKIWSRLRGGKVGGAGLADAGLVAQVGRNAVENVAGDRNRIAPAGMGAVRDSAAIGFPAKRTRCDVRHGAIPAAPSAL